MTNPETTLPNDDPGGDALATAALLNEPVRGALYAFVAGRDEPVDRDEAASAVGVGRPLAAFHLDRLVAAGLLGVEYRRRSGRTGPGAGRPAKFYRRVPGRTVELTLPARRYRLAAEILVEGIDRHESDRLRDQVRAAARERGVSLARQAVTPSSGPVARRGAAAAGRKRLVDLLAAEGFEPRTDGDEIRLRNCPFDVLVADHRDVTCSMNLALLEGVSEEIGETGLRPTPQRVEGSCCVR